MYHRVIGTKRPSRARVVGAFSTIFLLAAACSATKGMEPSPVVRTSEPPKDETSQKVAMVDATILMTDCSKVSNYSATVAERTMRRLVEDCNGVPGGQAEFVATLLPGGRIQISAVDGSDATVPICVLRHQLEHQVSINKACKIHVQMEQKAATRAPDGPPP
jgi:hypothetical protein